MGFRRYSSFIGSNPSSIDNSSLQNHFEFEARNIKTPKGTAIFFPDRILFLPIEPIRAPSKNWADDWRDEPHNLTIYIFSKYLIGTGQSYRIFHKSLNYDTTLHTLLLCCVVP